MKSMDKSKSNVLSFMNTEHYSSGPLTVLQRAMESRLRIKVVTRSYRHIRGYCYGFVAAFDKYMNMALVDVDELYLQNESPQKRRKRIQRSRYRYKIRHKTKSSSGKKNITEESPFKYSEDSLHYSSDIDEEELTNQLNILHKQLEKLRTPSKQDSHPGASSKCDKNNQTQTTDKSSDKSSHSDDKFNAKYVVTNPKRRQLSYVIDSELQRKAAGLNVMIKQRHLNQVFLRGDNVVTVSIL